MGQMVNIAKGTTDPSVEFISRVLTQILIKGLAPSRKAKKNTSQNHPTWLQLGPFDCLLMGHSCKIGNMRCPGTLKNQNPQFEEKK